jgi:hypothetical protein
MHQAAEIVTHIMHETQLHLNYCQSFNISLPEILATEEHQGTHPPPSIYSSFFPIRQCSVTDLQQHAPRTLGTFSTSARPATTSPCSWPWLRVC